MENNIDAERESKIAVKEAEKLTGSVEKIKIRKQKDLQEATELLAQIKSTYKNIENKRKEITQPINQALKAVNKLFGEPKEKLESAEKVLKSDILDYQERIEKRAEKKINKIEEQVDSGDMEMSDAMGKLSNVNQGNQQINTESGSAHYQVRKRLEIADVSKLPPKYFLRDSVLEALRKEVSQDVKNGLPLPEGAKWIEEKNLVVRGAK